MAEGILSALLAEGARAAMPREILVAERVVERAEYLRDKHGVGVTQSVREVAQSCEVVFLAVRPQDVAPVAEELHGALSQEQLFVSIVAGKKLSHLRDAFGSQARLVRVMPNLALRVGEGMCAVCADAQADAQRVVEILAAAGKAVVLEERHFDAVTALSGSGPAYFAYMEQAMAAGGVALGLEPGVARLLAAQTMYGTAKFLRTTGVDLMEFISGVATKGGTTAAGMVPLEEGDHFNRIVAATLAAAAERSRELGS